MRFVILGKIVIIAMLTFVWVILSEGFSVLIVASGVLISIGCIYFTGQFLPFKGLSGVNFLRLITYPFYLIMQIYLGGFDVIRMVFMGANATIVEVKTSVDNEFLRVLLGNSISLTPGTISMDLKDETFTVLWLKSKDKPLDFENADELIKGGMERRLLKAQK